MKIKSPIIILVFIFIIFFNINLKQIFAATEDITLSAIVEGCGDDIINGSEQCDGADLGGASCVSRGYASGTLSCSGSCTFETNACILVPSNSGNTYGSYPAFGFTNVIFSGTATPYSKIFILKDGQLITTVVADLFGYFSSTISGFSSGFYNFSIYAENKEKIRSQLITFPAYITARTTNNISNIVIQQSTFIFDTKENRFLIEDLNKDKRVNFLDFSILRYWYNKIFPPPSMDFNQDGKIDLVDFSIMSYYWTG